MSVEWTKQGSWWREGVIYQIYPRSFADANGDGIGDLRGITGKLDYLSWLGVDAVWLNPIYPSPMADFGYDITDHADVDPLFGDLSDFERLVAGAHQRGLKVILDFVPNHTSSEHPWFVESRSSRENGKRGWYYWRDLAPSGGPPNNWISPFGGSQWEFDEKTSQYYLHTFHASQPDLNWRNPEVEEAMFDAARFWFDRGVDGFRIDVANFVMKDPELRDNPTNPTAGTSSYKYLGFYDTQLHLNDKGHEDIHPLYRRFRRLLDSYGGADGSERIAMGEVHLFEWPDWIRHWAAYYGGKLDELHLPLNFTLVGLPWDARRFRRAVDEVEDALPTGAWPNLALGSHDEPRIATRVGEKQARIAMMLLLTLRGTPILYYGDELGMENASIPPEKAQDPFGRHDPSLGRDPQRTPMRWDSSPNAGFCPEGTEPWLPLGDDSGKVNVALQREDPRSMLGLTWQLLALRRDSPALRSGSYETIEDAPEGCLAYLRRRGSESALVALNFGAAELSLRLPGKARGRVLVCTHPDRSDQTEGGYLRLRGYEGCVVGLSGTR